MLIKANINFCSERWLPDRVELDLIQSHPSRKCTLKHYSTRKFNFSTARGNRIRQRSYLSYGSLYGVPECLLSGKYGLATSLTYLITSLIGRKICKERHTLVSDIVVFISESCWSYHTH